MQTNIYNNFIFYSSLAVLLFCFYRLCTTKFDNKITRYFIWFVITGCLEILILIMLDNGLTAKYPILYLMYMPFQFLSPYYFSIFTFHYLQSPKYIKKYKVILLSPFVIFSSYYIFLKVNYVLNKPFISQKTINFISAEIEENLTVISLFLLGVWLYNIVKKYEKSLAHHPFSYVTRKTKWLRMLFLCNIILSVLWTINILYIYQSSVPKQASNYYGLWIAFILFYVISLKQGTPHFEKIEKMRKEGLDIVDLTMKLREIPVVNDKEETSLKGSINQPSEYAVNEDLVKVVTVADESFLKEITSLVEHNITNNELNVNFLLSEMLISRTQLHRRLKSLTGLSTSAFIRAIRLKKAKQLIHNDTANFKQISYDVGFSDPSYFTKCFKKEFSISPSEYASSIKKTS